MVGGVESHDAECALMHPGCQIEQVYLCRKPVDFRKSIDGLSVLIEQELLLSPFASTLYVCQSWAQSNHSTLLASQWFLPRWPG